MSRSQPHENHSTKKVIPHEYQDIPEEQRHYIGRDKASIETTVQQPDKYSYDRWAASRRCKLPEWELADEPDFDNRLDNIEEKETHT
jgi:hypothetical protein